MESQIKIKPDKHNIVFLFLCLGGLATLYIVGIFPIYSESNQLDFKIPQIQQKVNEQEQLEAMFSVVDKERKSNLSDHSLPNIHVSSLPQNQTDTILPDFEKIASNSLMNVIEVTPSLKKSADLKRLVIKSKLNGDFSNIRSFLFDLLNLPYVNQINKIELKPAGKELRCNLTFSINLS